MLKVLMYCTAACPFCQAAERLLIEKGVAIDKIRVDIEPARRGEMMQRSGRRTGAGAFAARPSMRTATTKHTMRKSLTPSSRSRPTCVGA